MEIGFHYAVILPFLGGALLAASLIFEKNDNVKSRLLLKLGLSALIVGWLVYTIPFVKLDYTLAEVARNANNDIPYYMRPAVAWSGGGGSLYLYTSIISIAFLYALARRETTRLFRIAAAAIPLLTLASATLNGAFDVNHSPAGGFGLNPLLKNFWIIPHPLTTFGGFALLLAGSLIILLAGDRYKGMAVFMAGWAALTFGIMFGAIWSYETFGWGGYWAWDPVETAELAVWLAATASIHMVGPTAPLRRSFLYLTASTALLAPFITRSGLSPLHSFAAAEIGSILLYAGASVFLVASVYELSLNVNGTMEALKKAVVNAKRDPAPISAALASLSVAAMAFFVYASLYLPSTLVVIGHNVSLPTMQEGINFYHPILYPLFMFSLLWIPGYFLAREIGVKGQLGFLAIAITTMAVVGYAIWSGSMTPLPGVSLDTNIRAGIGIALSSLSGGLLAVSLARKLVQILRKRVSGRKTILVFRDSLLKLIHIGVTVSFIGVALSGSYAFGNQYFQTVNIQLGEPTSIGPVEVSLIDYSFAPNGGVVDIKNNLDPRTATLVLAQNTLAIMVQDIGSAVEDVRKIEEELPANHTMRTALEIASYQGMRFEADATGYSGNATIGLYDVSTDEREILYDGPVDRLVLERINGTVKVTPQFTQQGNLIGAWIEFHANAGLAISLPDDISPGVLNFHRYLEINLSSPITVNTSFFTINASKLVVYIEPTSGEEEVVIAGDNISIANATIYVLEGTLETGDESIPCPYPMDRGLYLYYLVEEGHSTILAAILNSSLADILSEPGTSNLLASSVHSGLPIPDNVPSGVYLDLEFTISKPGQENHETRIRFEANGEASGIHGLVTPALIVRKGLSDVYISVQPPMIKGFYGQYHEPLIYYLSTARTSLAPEEALALTALMASGYKIAEATQMDPLNSSLLLEQTTVDMYILAEKYDPANSTISQDGIYVMYKVIPGTILVWAGVTLMGIAGFLMSLYYIILARRDLSNQP